MMRELAAIAALVLPLAAQAQDCGYSLWTASRKTVDIDGVRMQTITGYANNNKRTEFQLPDRLVEMYGAGTLVLVKGYVPEQLAPQPTPLLRSGMLEMQVIFLLSASYAPLCHTPGVLPVRVAPDSGFGTVSPHGEGEGEMVYGPDGELRYTLSINEDGLWPDRAKVRYSGEISFAPRAAAPSDDTDFSGYVLLTPDPETAEMRVWGIAGQAGIPSTLGALRRHVEPR